MNDPLNDENLLDQLSADAPTDRMRSRFDALLTTKAFRQRRNLALWSGLAAASILAVVALLTFREQATRPAPTDSGPAAVLVALGATSSFERLQAVSAIADRSEIPAELESALLERIENDPSVNVRLAAVRALLARDPSAIDRERLTSAFTAQQTAIVQAHLGYQLLQNQLISKPEIKRLIESSGARPEVHNALVPMEES